MHTTTSITESKKISIEEMVELLKTLNPDTFFRVVPVFFGAEKIIEGNIPIEKLKLPEDFYYSSDQIRRNTDIHYLDGFYYKVKELEN